MKLVKVKPAFYSLCKKHDVEKELLFNEQGRPCVLLVQLRFRNKLQDFVVPLRSNISKKTPIQQYFSLPPNSTTRNGCHHGVHYAKLFPIDKKYIDTYVVAGNAYYQIILQRLDMNERKIINACQAYLHEYENGRGCFVAPDIDGIMKILSYYKTDCSARHKTLAE